jgi:glycosyltransferase involved in cell wall biosynthesis
MASKRPTICLNMIVKDEERVIRRCLDSVLRFIDTWVIVDTGSSDATREIIREHLATIPGELFERPWKSFGHNRTEALELARGRAEYTLLMDADEVMIAEPSFVLGELPADQVMVRHEPAELEFSFMRATLVRNRLPWRYVGVLHEAIVCAEPFTTAELCGVRVKYRMDSARNEDPRRKYERDAAILEAGLRDEPGNARYVFYLAQSYRDAGQLEKSLETYERRAAMAGWDEEVWYSLFQIAVLRERLKHAPAEVLAAGLRAYQYRPARAEPLCQLARYYRARGEFAIAHLFAAAACRIARPTDILFVDEAVYSWRALDELAISAFYVGQREQGLAAANRLLREGKLPEAERARVQANRAFYLPSGGEQATAREKRKREKRQNKRR